MNQGNAFATYPTLRDRIVLITGGGSGIGASIVEQFSLQGAQVAFLDIAVDSSHYLVTKLSATSSRPPLFIPCDLTDIVALQGAVASIEAQLGPINVLVNNAARDDRHNYVDVTPEYWDHAMNVNLRHQFFAIQSVVPGMKQAGGGSIINMSSISWMIPSTGFPAYATAKAAIIGLTRTMSHELGKDGIRVNAVLPGAVLTERQRQLWWTPEYEARITARQALTKHITPDDVARLILFLAADDSAAITNQSYIIDAGWV